MKKSVCIVLCVLGALSAYTALECLTLAFRFAVIEIGASMLYIIMFMILLLIAGVLFTAVVWWMVGIKIYLLLRSGKIRVD